MIDADHDGRRLDDGIRLLADLKTELVDGVQADGRGDDVAALQLDADDAVDGTLLDGDNLALELIACTEFHVIPPFFHDNFYSITHKPHIVRDLCHKSCGAFCFF